MACCGSAECVHVVCIAYVALAVSMLWMIPQPSAILPLASSYCEPLGQGLFFTFNNSQVATVRAPSALCAANMLRILSAAALGVGVRRSAAPAAAAATTHASDLRGRSGVSSEDPGALDSTILMVCLLLAVLASPRRAPARQHGCCVLAWAAVLMHLAQQGAQLDTSHELPGLEGRCNDAGWFALCTGGDGRDLLRLAASRAIQRGDLARRAPSRLGDIAGSHESTQSLMMRFASSRLGLEAALADASRGAVARAAARARERARAVTRPVMHAAADFSMDAVKPLYEGIEHVMEKMEAPAAGVTHAYAEGMPPRWRRHGAGQHPPPPL